MLLAASHTGGMIPKSSIFAWAYKCTATDCGLENTGMSRDEVLQKSSGKHQVLAVLVKYFPGLSDPQILIPGRKPSETIPFCPSPLSVSSLKSPSCWTFGSLLRWWRPWRPWVSHGQVRPHRPLTFLCISYICIYVYTNMCNVYACLGDYDN